MSLITEKMPAPSREQLKKAFLLGQSECIGAGLAQVHDMGIDREALDVLQEMDATGDLRIRVYALLDGSVEDLGALMGDGPPTPKDASSRLVVRGVKFFIDGALGSRGALLLKPYSDDRKNSGFEVTKPEILEARIRTAAEKGYQVATHAIGDRGNRIVLDIYERVLKEKIREARPRVEHAQIIDPSDIPRFGASGIIASMQPTHATSDMGWAEKRLGKDRLEGAYAWQSLLSRNATIAAGSDAPVEDISPVLGLYAAIVRKDPFGSPEGGWLPQERMTALQAVEAFTTGAAYASFRENEAGRIKKGFAADMTVLDKDPLTASEEDLAGMQVMLTIIGGRVEFAKKGADAPPQPPAVKTSTVGTSTRTRSK
jgi:predicted amidohydrolase YtcJ